MAAGLLLWAVGVAHGADTARIDHFLRQRPAFLQNPSLAALRMLGTLRHETARTVSDPYDPIRVDEYRTLVFDGLTIYGLVVARDLWPIRVTVTTPNWEMPDGLNVGAPIERVTALLGTPTGSAPAMRMYQGESESVIFSVRAAIITRIELVYYPD